MRIILENINKSIEEINDTINQLLLEDDGGIIVIPKGSSMKKKFTVVADGDLPENTDNQNYITLTDARDYKPDAEVGDEIEIEVLDFENSTLDDITDFFSSDDVSLDKLKQITIGGPKTYKVGKRILRIGPKAYKTVKKAASSVLMVKRYFNRYGKKIGHSKCYCVKLVKEYVDMGTGKIDRNAYESDVADYIQPVTEEFLAKWDYCVERYGKYIEDKDPRQETIEECITLDDMWEESKSITQELASMLQKFFKVKGIEIKKSKKDSEIGSGNSASEKIALKDEVSIKFTADSEWEDDSLSPPRTRTIFSSGDDVLFDIVGTFKTKNDTVMLENKSDGKRYVLSFESAVVGKPQSGKLWRVKPDNTLYSGGSTWSGKINYFK
jgi:hypothetical protein